MKELKNIVKLYQRSQETGDQTVMASVVNISGSAYRRPGAHMLFTRAGDFAGSISGGCLERDVIERFDEVVRSSKPLMLAYSARDIDDEFALGLGCDGSIEILLEVVAADNQRINLVELFDAVESSRRKTAFATIIGVDGGGDTGPNHLLDLLGSRLALSAGQPPRSDRQLAAPGFADLQYQLQLACEQALVSGTAGPSTIAFRSFNFQIVKEIIEPSVQIVIFGGGHDAIPLVEIAHTLGMRSCVFDRRPAYANRRHFPNCDAIVVSGPDRIKIEEIVDDRSACIVMNHQIDVDRNVIACLLPSAAPYIGILGPKRRTARMLRELQESGVQWQASTLARLFSPVGVDIGAETPEEIALSIVAEIKSVFQGSSAGFLRDKNLAIHDDGHEQNAKTRPLRNAKKQSTLPACSL